MTMLVILNRYLGIPLESLIAGNKEVILEPESLDKILGAAIKNYFYGSKAALF